MGSSHAVEVNIEKGTWKIGDTSYPVIGFGTYPLKGKVCSEAIEKAIQSGYRVIDTATYYQNFEAIAQVLKGKNRRDLYIVSKVWHDEQSPADLRKDLASTLAKLQTSYLDLYLLHWPNSSISIEKTLAAMEELRKAGKIRHIGLSNVTVNHLKRALELKIPITWVQVEMNPLFYDPALLEFCREHHIGVQAWGPLGSGRISEDALLLKIGKKYKKTPSQVAIRWILQHGCMPLPSSQNKQHIQDNFAVTDFALSKEEMQEIDQRAKNGKRMRLTKEQIGFNDEFDFSYDQCWPKR
jgi:diketogulonate reductase-like aldo/keto reductase